MSSVDMISTIGSNPVFKSNNEPVNSIKLTSSSLTIPSVVHNHHETFISDYSSDEENINGESSTPIFSANNFPTYLSCQRTVDSGNDNNGHIINFIPSAPHPERVLRKSSSSTSLSSSSSYSSFSSLAYHVKSDSSNYLESIDSDYFTKSEASTLSSSPLEQFDYPPIDLTLLEAKFASFGFSKYTIYPPAIKGQRSLKSSSLESAPLMNNGSSSSEEDNCEPDEDDEVFMVHTSANKGIEKIGQPRPPLIRSKSMKTGKTPPGTPKKKVVRFADALGLEFEYIKLISQDELPVIPKSAYVHLRLPTEPLLKSSLLNDANNNIRNSNLNDNSFKFSKSPSCHNRVTSSWFEQGYTLLPEFYQPGAVSNFYERVQRQAICLDSCSVSRSGSTINITCLIRVANISYEKKVTLRHTLTEWKTWTDTVASYLPESCDGWSDQFTVTIPIRSNSPSRSLVPGQRVLFACKFNAANDEYWDNNMGLNYSLIFKIP